MPLVDYHVHPNTFKNNKYWSTSQPLVKYIEICREKGIIELGFAEHGPRYHPTYTHTALTDSDISPYIQTLKDFRDRQKDVKIRIGIEIDYTPDLENRWRDFLGQYKFDYVACSIHYLDDWLPTKESMTDYIKRGKTIEQLYIKYYKTMQKAAESKLFSFMAHPDLIKIHSLVNQIPTPSNLYNLFDETCASLKEYDQVIEFDTGWRKNHFNCYRPEPQLMYIAFQHNIPFTLGSDAHCAEDIGFDFEKAIQILLNLGYKQLVTFTKGKRNYLPIS